MLWQRKVRQESTHSIVSVAGNYITFLGIFINLHHTEKDVGIWNRKSESHLQGAFYCRTVCCRDSGQQCHCIVSGDATHFAVLRHALKTPCIVCYIPTSCVMDHL